ncbi:hypothetical protein [Corynebacterium lubricantis]|uniref:hypothetical protein n=1 Tax=Corynebacterium lubricantis TaxID=541095 RepID=UPI0003741D04|nr:hypothetical protein [Corynebacterium lubricantis]
MAHVDMWDIFKDVPDAALAKHFRNYLGEGENASLIADQSDAEIAELLRTASTGAEDDFAVTKIFDYALKFVHHNG